MLRMLIILLWLLLQNIRCQYPTNISANYKYTYSGKYVIDINSQIQKASWDYIATTFTVPYPKSLAGSDVLVFAILNDISFLNINSGINANILLYNMDGVLMTFYLYTSKASSIQKISIAYLIMFNSATLVGNLAAYAYTFNIYTNISKSNPHFENVYLPGAINTTGGVNIYAAIAGVYADPTNSIGTISVIPTFTLVSQYSVGVSFSSLSDDPTHIYYLNYVIILYNQGYLNYSTCQAINSIIEKTDSNYIFYSNDAFQMQSFNTFIGLTSFQVNNQTSLQFFVYLDPHYFWINSSQLYSYFSVSYLVFWCKYCDYRNPYLYTQNNLCYLSCPASTINNQSSLQCNPCFGNCTLPTVTTSNKFPIYAIVLISVFGVVIIIVIFVMIYFKYLKKSSAELYKVSKLQNIRKVINFKKDIGKIADQQSKVQIQMNQPQFYSVPSIPSMGNGSKTNIAQQQKQVRSQQWKVADQKIKLSQLCICSKARPYIRCSCLHSFHLTCLLERLSKDRKERHCPLCPQQIPTKVELYCSTCRQQYKLIDLDFFNEDRERLFKLQINCKNCRV